MESTVFGIHGEALRGIDLMMIQDADFEARLPRKLATIAKAAKELALLSLTPKEEKPLLDLPDKVADYMRARCMGERVEQFWVVLLNTRRRVIRCEDVSKGTQDTILVHPREVFRSAIVHNASAIILVHNHPSGDPAPSQADIKITKELVAAGKLLKIEVLDHIVMGLKTVERPVDYVSLQELGYMA